MATLPSPLDDALQEFQFPQREAAFFYGLFLRGHSPDELRRDIEVPAAVLAKWDRESEREPQLRAAARAHRQLSPARSGHLRKSRVPRFRDAEASVALRLRILTLKMWLAGNFCSPRRFAPSRNASPFALTPPYRSSTLLPSGSLPHRLYLFPGSSTVEHSAVNRRVASSNLARGAKFFALGHF